MDVQSSKPILLAIGQEDENYLKKLSEWFSQFFVVFTATSYQDAKRVTQEKKVDVILLDGYGIQMARAFRFKCPDALVCMMSSDSKLIKNDFKISCIMKKPEKKQTVLPVLNLWTQSNGDSRTHLLKEYHKYLRVYRIEPFDDLEALHMYPVGDPSMDLMTVNFRHPAQNYIKKTVCVALMSGRCPAGCKMCRAGQSSDPTYKCTAQEIVGQIAYGIKGTMIYEYCKDDFIVNAGYVNCGDPIFCEKELCDAIEIVDNTKGLDVSHTITTIADHIVLPRIMSRLAKHKVGYHISLLTADEEKRRYMIPISGKQSVSLKKMIDECSEHNAKTGQRMTAAIALRAHFNFSPYEMDALTELLHGTPFDVKVMIMNGYLQNYPETLTQSDVEYFVKELRLRGLNARSREHVGEGNVTCGNHVGLRRRAELQSK